MRAVLLITAALLGCSSAPAAEPEELPLAGAAGTAGAVASAGMGGQTLASPTGGTPGDASAGAPDGAGAPPDEAGGKPEGGAGGAKGEQGGAAAGGAAAGASTVGGAPALGGNGGASRGGAPSGGAPMAGSGGAGSSVGGSLAAGSGSAGTSTGGAPTRPEQACPDFTLYRVRPGACLRADGDYDIIGAVAHDTCASLHQTTCATITQTSQCESAKPYCDGDDLLVYVKGQTLGTTYVVHLYDDSPDNPVANCRCN